MKPTQFKDCHEKTWDLKINLGKAMLVDRSDFTGLTDEKIILSRYDQNSLKVVITDTSVLFAVIGILVREQCIDNFDFTIDVPGDADKTEENESLFQKKFCESIDGSCIESARTAFVEALSDFFPAAKTVLSTFLKQIDGLREKTAKRLETEILPMMTQQMDDLLDDEISKLKSKLLEKANET